MGEVTNVLTFLRGAPILDLLLRAGLCAPRLWQHALETLPAVERDESIDALSQGALPMPQVVWEWAVTLGVIDARATTEQTVDLRGFYDAVFALTDAYAIELSMALVGPRQGRFPVMPPFSGQRVQLVNRTAWIDAREYLDEYLEDPTDEAAMELFGLQKPAMRLGQHRVGETWLRIAPVHLTTLREQPDVLLELLQAAANARVVQMREMLRLKQQQFSENDIAKLQEQLKGLTSWQRVVDGVIEQLRSVDDEKRTAMAAGILEIVTGYGERLAERAEAKKATAITVFISYARESAQHDRWVRKLADALHRFPDVDVVFDQYDLHGGKDLNSFMERSIECDRIVVVVTPDYVRKAEEGIGGVGYESTVISRELLANRLADRVVPVLRVGDKMPTFLQTKLYVDFRNDEEFAERLAELRRSFRGRGSARRPPKRVPAQEAR